MKLTPALAALALSSAGAFAPISKSNPPAVVSSRKQGTTAVAKSKMVLPSPPRSFALRVATEDEAAGTTTTKVMEDVPVSGAPLSSVTGTVNAPLNVAWSVFRQFGEPTTEWWKIYKYLKLDGDSEDVVGAERTFEPKKGGRTTTERLVERDDANHKLSYALVSGSGYPEGYDGTTTVVEMKESGDGKATEVTWSSWSLVAPTLEAAVKEAQEAAYTSGIAALDTYLNPPPSAAERIGGAALLIGSDFAAKIADIVRNMVDTEADDPWEYSEYDAAFGPLPKYCKTLPAAAAIMPFRTGQLFQRNNEYIYSQAPVVGNLLTLKDAAEFEDGHPFKAAIGKRLTKQGRKLAALAERLQDDPFLAPFTGLWMPEPKTVIDNLKKDEETSDMEIAAQLIRGVNPMKITVATTPDDLPAELRTLKDKNGRSVQDLIAAKSLFYCDYWEVEAGDYDEDKGVYFNQATRIGSDEPLGDMKYWYAPKLAVYKNEEGKLDILGFSLTRFTDKPNDVYTQGSTPPNLYQLAKYHLTCADNQQHQFVSHLGMAHLNMEGFAVANHNVFPPTDNPEDRHPVGRLLHPHFHDTIGINFLARQTLVSEVAPLTDATFSPGTVNAMKIFSNAFQKWDFFGDNFVNGLKARGFDEGGSSDGLDGYHYRDDGFKVWNALKTHFARCVDKIYASDKEVANDRRLGIWCEEVRDPKRGAMPSFPETIESKELLVETLTTIVFYCSAQHAAVNFSQLRYVSYVPNRPDSMRLPMIEPENGKKDIDAKKLVASLPNAIKSEFQTLFSYLLSTPPDNPFETYKSTGPEFAEETDLFLAELTLIHESIKFRNKKLVEAGDVPYEYLDPITMPQSINI